jgi:uncharacterized protein
VASTHDLLEAIRKRDGAAVRSLLDAEPELVHATAEDGTSPVMTAIYHGAGSALAMLVARGAVLDLHAAAAVGDVSRIRKLLENGAASIGSVAADGWTALHLAAFFGRTDAVEELLTRGADVHARSRNGFSNTPLHAAIAGSGGIAILEMLLAHDADANAGATEGITPLHLALTRGDPALVDALLVRGEESNARNDDVSTPAELAARRGHADLAARLSLPQITRAPGTGDIRDEPDGPLRPDILTEPGALGPVVSAGA